MLPFDIQWTRKEHQELQWSYDVTLGIAFITVECQELGMLLLDVDESNRPNSAAVVDMLIAVLEISDLQPQEADTMYSSTDLECRRFESVHSPATSGLPPGLPIKTEHKAPPGLPFKSAFGAPPGLASNRMNSHPPGLSPVSMQKCDTAPELSAILKPVNSGPPPGLPQKQRNRPPGL